MTTIVQHKGEGITPALDRFGDMPIITFIPYKYLYRKHLKKPLNTLQQIRCDVLEDHEWIPYKILNFDICKYGCGILRKDKLAMGIKKLNAMITGRNIIFPR